MRLTGGLLFALLLAAADEVTLPTSEADLARGAKLYNGSCLFCHGPRGDGGKGANLAQTKLPRAATDADLVRIIDTGIPGTEMPAAWHMTRREMTQVAAYVRTFAKVEARSVPGDANRGRELFAGKAGCQNCHTLMRDGAAIGGLAGPDLTGIGSRRSATHLKEALLDPAATLPEFFVQTRVETKSGKSVTGRRLHEDTFTILVRDYSGVNHTFLKSDVARVDKDRKKSPMPSVKDKLSAAEVDDVVAFLASLREGS